MRNESLIIALDLLVSLGERKARLVQNIRTAPEEVGEVDAEIKRIKKEILEKKC